MDKKAIVFDNSGTLLERYKVIKDIYNGVLLTEINSLDLIDSNKNLILLVLQFNTKCLRSVNPNELISNLIKRNNIDFDISYYNKKISKKAALEIINNDKAVIKDITDGFDLLKEKVPNIELCNESALIIDIEKSKIAYTITSAGKLFPNSIKTIDILKNREFEIYIASGDRDGAILKLASILGVNSKNAFGTTSTEEKCKIVDSLQNKGYKVMMVGDGVNDLLAFEKADVSVLTIEQSKETPSKLLNKTDFVIKDIFELVNIDF